MSATKTILKEINRLDFDIDLFWKIGGPILLSLGTSFNILVFVTIATRSANRTAIGAYLGAIALFDVMVLWYSVFRIVLYVFHFLDIRAFDEVFCQFQIFSLFTSQNAVTWLLVAAILDRFAAVCFPARAAECCNFGRSGRMIFLVFVLSALLSMHTFWTRGKPYKADDALSAINGTDPVISEVPQESFCGYTSLEAEHFWKSTLPICLLFTQFVMPFSIVVVLTHFILRSLVYQMKIRPRLSLTRKGSLQSSSFPGSFSGSISSTDYQQFVQHQNYMKRITRMTIIIAILSFLLQGPWVTYFILTETYPEDIVFRDTNASIVLLCGYIGHALKLVVYCLISEKFRKDVKGTLTCTCFGVKVDPTSPRGSIMGVYSKMRGSLKNRKYRHSLRSVESMSKAIQTNEADIEEWIRATSGVKAPPVDPYDPSLGEDGETWMNLPVRTVNMMTSYWNIDPNMECHYCRKITEKCVKAPEKDKLNVYNNSCECLRCPTSEEEDEEEEEEEEEGDGEKRKKGGAPATDEWEQTINENKPR